MAGFEVTPYGRFCLTPEDRTAKKHGPVKRMPCRGSGWGVISVRPTTADSEHLIER